MASPMWPRTVLICSACLSRFAAANRVEFNGLSGPVYQQIRGKKKMPNRSATVTVRLLKDVATYGQKGAIVPVATGRMRNNWFPQSIAEYVTRPDLKQLRQSDAAIQRDYLFTTKVRTAQEMAEHDISQNPIVTDSPELRMASMFQTGEINLDKLTPERVSGLVDIFVPSKLEFYRQPIAEAMPTSTRENIRGASGAANDLLQARAAAVIKSDDAQTIHGSVSSQDVLVAVRAAMAENDEARRVVLTADDVQFVDLPSVPGVDAERIKRLGEFVVEIRVKGAANAVRRSVKIISQES